MSYKNYLFKNVFVNRTPDECFHLFSPGKVTKGVFLKISNLHFFMLLFGIICRVILKRHQCKSEGNCI